ncbi:MAG: hypothetical protein V2B18_18940 [Pseudomonadota bacterium]
MTDERLFTELEKLNSQIDVWIDEENYPEIDEYFEHAEEDHRKELGDAFGDNVCAAVSDSAREAWDKILKVPFEPIKLNELSAAKGRPQFNDEVLVDGWSCLLWSKRLRSKIQERGTDCYLARLDQVIAYLERHMPFFDPNSPKTVWQQQQALMRNRLVVLCLLEMAAAGLEPESRGFAQRAKRCLKQILCNDPETENFKKFYDLVAEYHMAVGYFHEQQHEKGEAACTIIIRGFKCMQPDGASCSVDGLSPKYAADRLAAHLLYFPSVLWIAEVRAKQQLAHSAKKFIDEQFSPWEDLASRYQKALAHLVCAEAFLQNESMTELDREMQGLVDYLTAGTPVQVGLASRCIPLMLEYNMQWMRQAYQKVGREYKTPSGETNTALEDLNNRVRNSPWGTELFRGYWRVVENRKEDRQGFLIQLAQYLKFLTTEVAKDTWGDKLYEGNWANIRVSLFGRAETLYKEARWTELLRPKKPGEKVHSKTDDLPCPCKEDRHIDLGPVWENNFTDYQDTMRDFFREFNDGEKRPDDVFKHDEIQFLESVQEIQKRDHENLHWLDRKYDIRLKKLRGVDSGFACSRCLADTGRGAFSGLLGCAQECSLCQWLKRLGGGLGKTPELSARDYELIMKAWDKYFDERVSVRTRCPGQTEKGIHFLGLQRWNSTSPAMGLSRGGGYLLYVIGDNEEVELGIAVDPGFNFVENLQHYGFSVADVDIVVLSHSHLDHLRDFESMVSLCFEVKKRTKEKKRHRLHTVMTFGTYDRLGHLFKSPELRDFIEPYIIDMDKRLNEEFGKQLPDHPTFRFRLANGSGSSVSRVECDFRSDPNERACGVNIKPLRAFHNDHTGFSDSFGFRIEVTTRDGWLCSIGYTGDTAWAKEDLMGQYKGCDALLIHLGSLIGSKDGRRDKFENYKKAGEECYKLVAKQNHPYLPGLLHFLYDICKLGSRPLVLVSEFGEELRGRIRVDLFERLKEACAGFAKVLPVDVGLDVRLTQNPGKGDGSSPDGAAKDPAVWCVQCEHYVELSRADFETYGRDEALFCVCSTCRKSTPHNVIQDRLRRLYEEGRSLPRAREKQVPNGSETSTT